MRVRRVASLAAATALAVGGAFAQDFSVDWHTIDGGGEMLSETADQQWQLSGTIGQPDATELIDLAGGGWSLTSGFWAVNIDETDQLFRDSFEGETP
jgi:hypothetical protein